MKIGSVTPHFLVKSGVQLRIFNAKLDTNPQITKRKDLFLNKQSKKISTKVEYQNL